MTNPPASNDAELFRQILAGDEHAFTALYRRHQGSVYRFALLMSGSASTAEEVVQEVFLALIRDAQRYDPARAPLSSYLGGIARNHVLRLLARERNFVPLIDDVGESDALPPAQLIGPDDPFGNYARNETTRLLRQAVLALPARYREVIVLCDFQELSNADAALVLGCPAGTVNSRLHRGHTLLLKKLREMGSRYATAEDTKGMRCFV